MGLVIGIYAGEVPAIQHAIADEHHYTMLGNVLLFLGLAVTTAFFYPLLLLHGRKAIYTGSTRHSAALAIPPGSRHQLQQISLHCDISHWAPPSKNLLLGL